MYYFCVFAGVFELYGAAGFSNSIIVLHIPPHYSKYKYIEGRYKVPDASSWTLGHVITAGVLYVSLMMMNCFCRMVDCRKAFSLISSRHHCQRSSTSRISDTPRAGLNLRRT